VKTAPLAQAQYGHGSVSALWGEWGRPSLFVACLVRGRNAAALRSLADQSGSATCPVEP
jgi:hypothetical protein